MKNRKPLLTVSTPSFFEFEPERLCLRHRGITRRLETMPAKVLAHMLALQGEPVSRAELVQLLWPCQMHGDFPHRLDKVINKLRMVLGDDPARPVFIQTLRGKGFVFIGADRINPLPRPKSSSDRCGNSLQHDAV